MLREFLARPEVTEHCELRGRFGIMAYHGGNLERTTDAVAAEVATRTDSSFYAVTQDPPHRNHIASTHFVPEHSPALARFLDYVLSRDQVWITRRIDIARHWLENFPHD